MNFGCRLLLGLNVVDLVVVVCELFSNSGRLKSSRSDFP